eukprot:gene4396-biopygen3167
MSHSKRLPRLPQESPYSDGPIRVARRAATRPAPAVPATPAIALFAEADPDQCGILAGEGAEVFVLHFIVDLREVSAVPDADRLRVRPAQPVAEDFEAGGSIDARPPVRALCGRRLVFG